jgi:hypothetical protein
MRAPGQKIFCAHTINYFRELGLGGGCHGYCCVVCCRQCYENNRSMGCVNKPFEEDEMIFRRARSYHDTLGELFK